MTDVDPSNFPTLTAALAEFHKVLPPIRKGNRAQVDGARGSYSYDYADLADVSDVVLPLLGSFGLVWMTRPDTAAEGTIDLHYSLTHAPSGEKIEGSVPVGKKGDRWQDLGAALTYARRYMLVAVTGVAPGGDDNDGRGASAGAGSATQAPPVAAYLPVGLYDLTAIDSAEKAKQTFYVARGAGHLGLLVQTPEGAELPFADWLRAQAAKFPEVAPEDEPKVEADDAEAAERAAVEAHEREIAEQEAALSSTATARKSAKRDQSIAEAAGPTAREEAETAMREQGA